MSILVVALLTVLADQHKEQRSPSQGEGRRNIEREREREKRD